MRLYLAQLGVGLVAAALGLAGFLVIRGDEGDGNLRVRLAGRGLHGRDYTTRPTKPSNSPSSRGRRRGSR